jgi:hypothetical protein
VSRVLTGESEDLGAGGDTPLEEGETCAASGWLPHDEFTVEDDVDREGGVDQPTDVGEVRRESPSCA